MGEVHLLIAGEREQKVDRSLEALEGDDESPFPARGLDSGLVFEIGNVH